MAPINQKSCYSTYSTSNRSPFSCKCRNTLDDGWEWFLPITRRGSFFQDSFFENSRSYFDSAIKDVLGRWGESSMLADPWYDSDCSNLSRYRQLRSHNMKEDNQAVTLSSDSTSHKIVLDVHEFLEGEVKVKVIGEKEILVEGNLEEKTATIASSSVQQKFSRRFPLAEDAEVEAISSVMSSDGVLTITIPRKKSSVGYINQMKVENQQHTSSTNVSEKSNKKAASVQEKYQTTSNTEEDTKTSACARYCENCYKKLQAEKKIPEHTENTEGTKIPVKISASTINNERSSQHQSLQNGFESKAFSESKVKETHGSSVTSSTSTKEEYDHSNQSQTKRSAASNVVSQDSKERVGDKEGTPRSVPISVNFHPLPISRRGQFFSDSIFENARDDFQSAVQEVLNRWGERSSIMDNLSCYRNLRTRDLREENQAIKVNEDENNHKFVLDVHDFMNGGEVNVKAVNDREIVVEGQVEKQEGGSKSMKRFHRRFAIPHNIILDSVTSVMSSDGVLTITAPKKAPTIEIRDVTSPTRSEKTQDISSKSQQSNVNNHNETYSSEINSQYIQKTESASNKANQTSSQHSDTKREHIIPVHVEEIQREANYVQPNANIAMTNKTSQENVSKETSTSLKTNNSSHEEVSKTRHEEAEISKCHMESSQTESNSSNKQQQLLSSNGRQEHQQILLNTNTSTEEILPFTHRGSFFSDSFFENCRQNFQLAMKDVLKRFNDDDYHTDALTAYRDFRQQNLSAENQAVSVQEDEQHYKIVLDARDFSDGDIAVSVIDKELLIEGQAHKKEGSSSSAKTFSRRFLLPDSVDIHSIASNISSDGILTIESNKLENKEVSNVKKAFNEAHSRQESHSDSGHKWEEKATKESSEQSDGYSCRTYSTSYRSHQEHSSVNVL